MSKGSHRYTRTSCVRCRKQYTEARPCCCDDGFEIREGVEWHDGGFCVKCCKAAHALPVQYGAAV